MYQRWCARFQGVGVFAKMLGRRVKSDPFRRRSCNGQEIAVGSQRVGNLLREGRAFS